MAKDMTKGSALKEIILFTLPLLVGNIFQQLYSMVDTIIVGNYVSTGALAAVGVTGSITFLILGFVQGVTAGIAVVTAQRFGAGDKTGVKNSIGTCYMISVVLTVVVTIVGVLSAKPLLVMMSTPDEILQDAYIYTVIIMWGTVATVFYNIISSIIRSLGDSRTPLIFLIIASVINIVLDILFLRGFGMGVDGAAWATVISQMVSGLLCLIYCIKKYPEYMRIGKENFALDKGFMAEHLKIGLPMGFQFSVTAVGVIVIQAALNTFGTVMIAAYTAASRIQMIIHAVLNSIGTTLATFAAQNFGAGKMHRIRKGTNICVAISLVVSFAGTAMVLLCNNLFVNLFIKDPTQEIIDASYTCLLISGTFFFVLGLLFVYRNVLQGIGRGTVPFLAGVSELVMRILSAMLLSAPFGFAGVCAADPIAWWGAAIPLAIAYFVVIKRLDPREKEKKTKKNKQAANI